MKLLDRHIGIELVGPFLFGVAAFTSIFFAGQQLIKLTSQVLSGGMPALTAVELVVLALPSVAIYTLPMSALLSVLLGFSRLSGDSEIVALYACGVSLYRAMIPVVAMGLLVTAMGFVMNELVVPGSSRLQQDVQAHFLKEQLSTDKPVVIFDKDKNATIFAAGGVDAKSRTMRGVTITRFVGDTQTTLIRARIGRWTGKGWKGEDNWVLSDGSIYSLDPNGATTTVTFRGLDTRTIQLSEDAEALARSRLGPEQMSFWELKKHISVLSGSGVPPDQLLTYKMGLLNKIAIPFAALVFALIGAPLAVRPARAGTSFGIGLSILIIIMYYLVWHFSTALAGQGSLPPVVGAFLADVLGLILAVILLARTPK